MIIALCILQGIIQSGFVSWNTLQPVACLRAPCNFTDPVRALSLPWPPAAHDDIESSLQRPPLHA